MVNDGTPAQQRAMRMLIALERILAARWDVTKPGSWQFEDLQRIAAEGFGRQQEARQ